MKVNPSYYVINEIEAALFSGLEAVQGPKWADILQLYGPGGSISEALKDRSQVQLKDKARNLKLSFLKSGEEVPSVFERVTGQLKNSKNVTADGTPARSHKRRRTSQKDERFPAQMSQEHSQPGQIQQDFESIRVGNDTDTTERSHLATQMSDTVMDSVDPFLKDFSELGVGDVSDQLPAFTARTAVGLLFTQHRAS
jgi:hypothetical protein